MHSSSVILPDEKIVSAVTQIFGHFLGRNFVFLGGRVEILKFDRCDAKRIDRLVFVGIILCKTLDRPPSPLRAKNAKNCKKNLSHVLFSF